MFAGHSCCFTAHNKVSASCFLTSTVSHDGGWGSGAGWLLHTDGLPSQTARYQTLDRGLRPGPELFWETKNGSEIPTQGKAPHKIMACHRICQFGHANEKNNNPISISPLRDYELCVYLFQKIIWLCDAFLAYSRTMQGSQPLSCCQDSIVLTQSRAKTLGR